MGKKEKVKTLKTDTGFKSFEKAGGYEMEPNYSKLTNQIKIGGKKK